MRSLDKRVNHFKLTNEIIWFKGNFGNFEIKENFRRFNAPKWGERAVEGRKKKRGERRKERKERNERKVKAKWKGEFFLLLQAFQVLYK